MAVDEDNADNLAKIAIDKTIDTGAYLLRKSPAGKYSANETIIGGTVAWNQLIQNGNFADTSNWRIYHGAYASLSVSNNVATITYTQSGTYHCGLTQDVNCISGHLYFMTFYVLLDYDGRFGFDNFGGSKYITCNSGEWAKMQIVWKSNISGSTIILRPIDATTVGKTAKIKNVNVVDLTQAFGTTIADYLVTVPGEFTGRVEKLKEWGFLSKGYYDYDAGTLRSVNTSGKKIVGKNLVNTNTIITGYYNGNTLINDNNYRTSELISAIPNTTYSFSIYNKTTLERVNSLVVDEWDGDRKWIANHTNVNTIITLPNCMYLTVRNYYAQASLITSDNFLYQLEISSEPSTYELYESHTYTLSPTDLRGIPKLDSSNNLYYDGDIYESTGKVTRKYGIVDLGTLTWNIHSSGIFFAHLSSNPKSYTSASAPAICAKYVTIATYSEFSSATSGIYVGNYLDNVNIKDSSYTDATAFKTAMSGVYLVYELATPTSEITSTFANDTPVNPDGIEEFIDNRDVPIPVGHNTKYGDNKFIGEILSINNAQERIDNNIKTIVTDGVKTIKDIFNELYDLIDKTKINYNSYLIETSTSGNKIFYRCNTKYSDFVSFTCTKVSSTGIQQISDFLTLHSSNSRWERITISTSSVTTTNYNTTVDPSGKIYQIIY